MPWKSLTKRRSYQAQYYKDHRDKLKSQAIQYAKDHPDERKSYNRAYYKANREYLLERQAVTGALYFQSHREEVAVKNARWMKAHPDKMKAYTAKYRAANEAKVKATAKAWRARHLARIKWVEAEYYHANQKKRRDYSANYRQANPDKVKETQRKWATINREKVLEKNSRRRAQMRGNAAVKYSRAEIIERDGPRCHICKRKIARLNVTIDHLVPVSQGGSDAPWNVAIAHKSCNSKRGAGRFPAQFPLLVNL